VRQDVDEDADGFGGHRRILLGCSEIAAAAFAFAMAAAGKAAGRGARARPARCIAAPPKRLRLLDPNPYN
jgi:hypothetical protein